MALISSCSAGYERDYPSLLSPRRQGEPPLPLWTLKKYPLRARAAVHCAEVSADMQAPPTTETEVFLVMFDYIDRLFGIVRPRKLLYMAIGELSQPFLHPCMLVCQAPARSDFSNSLGLQGAWSTSRHGHPLECGPVSKMTPLTGVCVVFRWRCATSEDEPAEVQAIQSCSGC